MSSLHTWDSYFLRIAQQVSLKSKDPSTKVGAVIVRPDNSLCSVGYNGFPQCMPDDASLYANREEKLSRIIHAEVNALTFSRDADLTGYTMYTWPLPPCERCCVQMLQAGIVRFVAPTMPPSLEERWNTSLSLTKKYIQECGRELVLIDFTPSK